MTDRIEYSRRLAMNFCRNRYPENLYAAGFN